MKTQQVQIAKLKRTMDILHTRLERYPTFEYHLCSDMDSITQDLDLVGERCRLSIAWFDPSTASHPETSADAKKSLSSNYSSGRFICII